MLKILKSAKSGSKTAKVVALRRSTNEKRLSESRKVRKRQQSPIRLRAQSGAGDKRAKIAPYKYLQTITARFLKKKPPSSRPSSSTEQKD